MGKWVRERGLYVDGDRTRWDRFRVGPFEVSIFNSRVRGARYGIEVLGTLEEVGGGAFKATKTEKLRLPEMKRRAQAAFVRYLKKLLKNARNIT